MALAASGYAAVAPGVDAEYAAADASPAQLRWVGEVATAIVERDVLAPLRRGVPAAGGALDPARVDLDGLVLVGHSRGAAVAGVIGQAGRPLSVPVRAAVLLAPGADTVDPSLLADRPTAVVLGTCDGDTGIDGGELLTAAMRRPRRTPVALVVVEGATHNAYNAGLGPDPELLGRPACDDANRLSPAAQRSAMARLVPELLRSLTGRPAATTVASALTRRTRPDDRVVPGVRVVHVDTVPGRRTVLAATAPWPTRGSEASGMQVTRCPAGRSSPYRNPRDRAVPSRRALRARGPPATLQLGWSAPGAALRVGLDGDAGAVVVLRLYADPLDIDPAVGVVELRVTGDGPSGTWSRNVSVPVSPVGDPLAGTTVRRGALLWSERRLVLPARTATLSLAVVTPSAGSVGLLGIDLVAPA